MTEPRVQLPSVVIMCYNESAGVMGKRPVVEIEPSWCECVWVCCGDRREFVMPVYYVP